MTNGFYDGSAEADRTWPLAVFIADPASDGDDPIRPAGGPAGPPRRPRTLREGVLDRVRHGQEAPRAVRANGDPGLFNPLFGGA
jgi:hypothetical protein